MTTGDRPSEPGLDRLLEGGLPSDAADRLRQQLRNESRRLELDLRSRMQRYGSGVPGIEPAPASLRARLRAIPGAGGLVFRSRVRWSLATSCAALLIALLVVYQIPRTRDAAPSQAEIDRARSELAIAFSYLRQVGSRSEYYMKREIGHTMQEALSTGILHGVAEKLEGG